MATDFCRSESGDILTSLDSGATWTSMLRVTNPPAGRIGLGVGSDGTAYAALAACPNSGGGLVGIQKTVDGAQSWGPVPGLPPAYMTFAGTNPPQGQGWYDNAVAVDPGNSANAVFGGITIVRTTDGGAGFSDVGQPYSGGTIHPDFHALAFTGNGSLYAGNDGGVWQTADLGSTWTNRNGNLNTLQFYSGTSPDPTHVVGGAQDNGTPGILPGSPVTSPAWQEYLDGDGGYTLLDPTPGSTAIYASTPSGGIWKGSYQPPASPDPNWPYDTFVEADPCPSGCNQPTAFIAPVLMDQTNPSRLLTATNVVYQAKAGGLPAGSGGWAAISSPLTNGSTPTPDFIASMTMGTTASTVSTVLTGSYYGALYKSTNATGAGASWTNIAAGLPMFSQSNHVGGEAWISGIAFNQANPNEAWVTIGALNIGHVWHTVDGGAAWADISGSGATGVPSNLVVNGIIFDATAPGIVYIATDLGVLACLTCTGSTPAPAWSTLGTALPHAKVDWLSETADHNQLVAWTHGRGAWMVPVSPVLDVQPPALTFTLGEGGTKPRPQALSVTNDGVGTLTWTATSTTTPAGQVWLHQPIPAAGSDGPKQSSAVSISLDPTGLAVGTYHGTVSFTSSGGSASVTVTLVIPPFPGQYRPVVPYRVLDTRTGTGGFTSPLTAPVPIDVQIAGTGGPAGVPSMPSATPPSAVVLNVTVTNETQPSHVIIYPTGTPRPDTSNLNFVAHQDVPNLVEVALGTGGKVSAYVNAGSTDIIFDVEGWVTTTGTVSDTAGLYRPVVPSRILDTRVAAPIGQIPYHLQVSGRGGIPPIGTTGSPEAVILNLTITNPTSPGYVTVYPSDAIRPGTSNLNVVPGLTRANRVAVKLGADGAVDIFNYAGTTDVIVDVNGWFTDATGLPGSGGQFSGLNPIRILDTRTGIGGFNSAAGQGQAIALQVSGRGGVPMMSDAVPPTAVVVNVTATNTTIAGHLRVYPNQSPPPNTSDLNWISAGQTVPNLVIVKLSADGKIGIYSCCGSTDVIVDVFGWYE